MTDIPVLLSDVNISIKKGEFVGIFGEVGAGKSSLIQAIMNNLIIIPSDSDQNLNKNKIIINGDIAYSAQIPWISNETIRNNILLFNNYNEKRYKETLEVCQLIEDLQKFPGKDQEEIGEKAINLSGGQRARISLARAIYQDKSIYLLDDPLSALDKNVGDKIF